MVRTLRDNDDDMSDRIADAVRRAGVSVDDVVRSVLTDGRRTRTTPKSRDDDDIAGRNAWRGEHSREDELNEIGAAVRRLSDVGGRNAETRGRDNRRADAILDTLDALDRRIRTQTRNLG